MCHAVPVLASVGGVGWRVRGGGHGVCDELCKEYEKGVGGGAMCGGVRGAGVSLTWLLGGQSVQERVCGGLGVQECDIVWVCVEYGGKCAV